nr:hypothetical protein [Rhabdochromatium marinum]
MAKGIAYKLTQVATLADSEKEIEATGQDKECCLEFKTGSDHAVDMLG